MNRWLPFDHLGALPIKYAYAYFIGKRFLGPMRVAEQVRALHEPPPDEHRTPNIQHRTSKGACASRWVFGVRCWMFDVRVPS
jgi:hypothetical protein